MAGIMDMFKGFQSSTPAAPTPVPGMKPTPPGNIPEGALAAGTATALTAGTAPNGAIPAVAGADNLKSPLDAFADLWKTDPKAVAKPNDPYFNVDMATIQKAAKNQDFSGAITPEQLSAIAAGGEGAVAAFASAMNAVSQEVYARNAFATTKIIESALAKAEGKIGGTIPDLIKKYTVSDGLRTENPAFSHSAAQPIIAALEQQILQKHPNATSTELREMATSYLSAFAAATVPTKVDPAAARKAANETDWTAFL